MLHGLTYFQYQIFLTFNSGVTTQNYNTLWEKCHKNKNNSSREKQHKILIRKFSLKKKAQIKE